jgi:hypothetical protein
LIVQVVSSSALFTAAGEEKGSDQSDAEWRRVGGGGRREGRRVSRRHHCRRLARDEWWRSQRRTPCLVQGINCAEMKALPIQRWDDLLIVYCLCSPDKYFKNIVLRYVIKL